MWVNINVPSHFSPREADLFYAWSERVGTVRERGIAIDFMRDAIPMLAAMTTEHYPKSPPWRVSKTVDKLAFFYVQAQLLMNANAAGSA